MKDITETNKSTLKVQLGMNILFLIIGFFYVNKTIFFSLALFNMIFLGTYMVIEKYGFVFSTLIQTNRMAKTLNTHLEKFN